VAPEAYKKLDSKLSSCNPLNLIRQVDIQIGRKRQFQNQKKETEVMEIKHILNYSISENA
jgi:cytochrome c biogenesis protein ResB